MTASEPGTEDWWTVVLSMPLIERMDQLHAFRSRLVEKYLDKPAYNSITHHITRCNDELRKANLQIDNATWQRAARNVLPQEQFEAVLQEKRRLEDESPECIALRKRSKQKVPA